LFGDRIFQDFESRFLRKDWDSELRGRILRSPGNWFWLWSPFWACPYHGGPAEEALFEGKTYGDLVQRRPALLIHASDMATLGRFEFRQAQFDVMCSDLSQLPIAYASAASAALPLVLSPITLKNYAGQCDYQPTASLLDASQKTCPNANEPKKYSPFSMQRRGRTSICSMGGSQTTSR
jgi:NTE family protein